jgi:two-component system response regulator MprA
MRATLAAVGIEAVCFDNGADAVRAFESVSPAAVVLDLMMPALDGFAVLSLLQRLPSAQQTPIYVWTGLTLTEDEYRQLALSAGDIVAKGGADLAEMIDRLRQWRPQSTAPAD